MLISMFGSFVFMYAWMYVCPVFYVHMYVCVHTACMLAGMCVCMHANMYVFLCVNQCIPVCVYVCMSLYVYMHAYLCMCYVFIHQWTYITEWDLFVIMINDQMHCLCTCHVSLTRSQSTGNYMCSWIYMFTFYINFGCGFGAIFNH